MRGMSAAELSRRSGVDKAAISRYLSGAVKPKSEPLVALASVLKVSPIWLLGVDMEPDATGAEINVSGTEEKLKDLMIQVAGSVNNFANICGLPQSTIFSVLDRGIENTNFSTVTKICQALNISIDGLVQGKLTSTVDLYGTDIDLHKLTPSETSKLIGYYNCLLDSHAE